MIGNRKYQNSHVYGVNGVSRACMTNSEIYYAVPKLQTVIDGNQSNRVYDSNGLSKTISGECGGAGAKTGYYVVPKIRKILSSTQHFSVMDSNGLSPTVAACDYKDPHKIVIPCITPDRINKRQNGRRFKENNDPMFTLTAQDQHGVLLYDGKEYNIRKLTPRECFRLQGFSDEEFDKAQSINSDSQLYKQAGNAVTVNVAQFLGERLMEVTSKLRRNIN